METDVKTYRGRTLEELLPQIREELGPDAIVLRRREGLGGGVGGFFQKHFVEVDARKALPDEIPLEVRNDRATEEGLSTPGIQTLISQAAPFADSLARAENTLEQRAKAVLVAAAREKEPVAAGLYGPQPRVPREPVTPPAPFTPVEPEPFTPAALADLVAEGPPVSAPGASFSAADDAAPPATSAASFSAADDPAPLATSAAFADAAAPF